MSEWYSWYKQLCQFNGIVDPTSPFQFVEDFSVPVHIFCILCSNCKQCPLLFVYALLMSHPFQQTVEMAVINATEMGNGCKKKLDEHQKHDMINLTFPCLFSLHLGCRNPQLFSSIYNQLFGFLICMYFYDCIFT